MVEASFRRYLLVLLGACFASEAASAATLGPFADAAASSLPARRAGIESPLPRHYRAIAIDAAELAKELARAPQERAAGAPLVLALPYPDGTWQRFAVSASSILEAPLQARFPEIRTFVVQGLDDPNASGRLSLTSLGFHAMVLARTGTMYIDPAVRGDQTHGISYFQADARRAPGARFRCDANEQSAFEELADELGAVPAVTTGPTLRTYRLALAATGEYTAAVCAPNPAAVACAMNAMAVTMTRVNGVYEREVGVHMVLVANDNLLVYTDPNTDPYTNSDGATMLGQNQSSITSIIGSANYDIGHVFSTGGGGIAGLGVVCSSGNKARGVTGNSSPTGDGFDIDYVAHEMGHQFGGDHTFNGTTANCGGGNRTAGSAYEPGSGITIMAYAGICGTEDLAPHSVDTFHARSFDQIVTFITNTGTCAVQTSTGNTTPTVDAGPSYTIPELTPFTLTGTGSDPDSGEILSYLWEEFDLGTAAPPNTDAAAARPIFRTFVPTAQPVRTFPRWSDILNNTSTFGESLSSRNRTMTFRLTARDGHAGGGGVSADTTAVTITTAAGPFAVTQPNTAVTWTGNTSQAVTWNVANTTAAPVSCANVAIDLSTDGGATWGANLAASTPNDGTETVTVPNTPTTQARMRVSCVGNIFFDVSNANFTIVAGSGNPAPTVTTVNPVNGSIAGGEFIDVTGTGFVSGATVLFGASAAPSVTFHNSTFLTATSPAHAAGTVSVTVTNPDNQSGTLPSSFTYQLVGLGFNTLPPCRIVDTRNPNGPIGGPALTGGTVRSFTIAGNCGVPTDAIAVSVNLTVVPSGSGTLNAYASGLVPPSTSVVSFVSGVTRANNAVVGLNASGAIDVQTTIPAAGTTHFILDVNGFFR